MPVKNFFILQLELKMKKSKRYIKKQNNKPLINKKVLAKVIRESNICKHAIAIYKYRTNTGKMTASDYTHLFGYLNPYYRSAYNIPKRRK